MRGRNLPFSKSRQNQGVLQFLAGEPDKISASTPHDFSGHNLTAYGGLLPVATMLEKLRFPAWATVHGIYSLAKRAM
jgi:hypothetical protein